MVAQYPIHIKHRICNGSKSIYSIKVLFFCQVKYFNYYIYVKKSVLSGEIIALKELTYVEYTHSVGDTHSVHNLWGRTVARQPSREIYNIMVN